VQAGRRKSAQSPHPFLNEGLSTNVFENLLFLVVGLFGNLIFEFGPSIGGDHDIPDIFVTEIFQLVQIVNRIIIYRHCCLRPKAPWSTLAIHNHQDGVVVQVLSNGNRIRSTPTITRKSRVTNVMLPLVNWGAGPQGKDAKARLALAEKDGIPLCYAGLTRR
jgi:hypothetical protein